MKIFHSPRDDTLNIVLVDEDAAYTRRPDDLRMVDYSEDGRVIAEEFVGVSGGIDLSGLNGMGPSIASALREAGFDFKIYAA